jgi:hypothetical protein
VQAQIAFLGSVIWPLCTLDHQLRAVTRNILLDFGRSASITRGIPASPSRLLAGCEVPAVTAIRCRNSEGMQMPKQKKKSKAKKSKKKTKRSASQTSLKPASTNSKAAFVIELLERSGGVSITELASKIGWQPHTCRAKISILGKTIRIEKSKNTNGELVYRKVGGGQTASKSKR